MANIEARAVVRRSTRLEPAPARRHSMAPYEGTALTRSSQVPDYITHDQDLAALMAKVAARDLEALASFYDATSARVYRLVLRMVGDTASAEEVLLEVFAAVWQQAPDYQQRSCPPLLWVLMIARRLALDKGQSQQRPEPVVEQQEKAESSVDFPGFAEDASVLAPQAAILSALKTLPPEQQEVTELAHYSGASYTEIAELLDLPPETVKRRLYLAMLRLQEAYAHCRSASAKMQLNDKTGELLTSVGT